MSSAPVALREQTRLHSVLDPSGHAEALELAKRTVEALHFGAKKAWLRGLPAVIEKARKAIMDCDVSNTYEVAQLAEAVERMARIGEHLSKSEAATAISGTVGSAGRVIVAFENGPWSGDGQ